MGFVALDFISVRSTDRTASHSRAFASHFSLQRF